MRIVTRILLILSLSFGVVFISLYQPQHRLGLEYDVRVINGFRNNSSLPLVIWCSSADDDLGGRALQEGEDYGWRLKTKFWSATRIFCTLKWEEKRRKFDAFKIPRDIHRCSPFRKCSWLVREDGFYFSNDEINWKKDFSWF